MERKERKLIGTESLGQRDELIQQVKSSFQQNEKKKMKGICVENASRNGSTSIICGVDMMKARHTQKIG